ncbi:MAG: TIGR04295 family B12-binding domain-containing radical SAM protein, partial [Syntrophobacteraceae bacterium]
AALRKTGADLAIRGEFETILPLLADISPSAWQDIPAVSFFRNGNLRAGKPHSCRMDELPALKWPSSVIEAHRHHHHRFHYVPAGPGAEIEASRGCPFGCMFCAKENFRSSYRKRPALIIIEEIEALLKQGVEYIYFIDELFLPDTELLSRLVPLGLKFGIQTRIDLWNNQTLELAGKAGCVSIEAGVESITSEGRARLGKHSILSIDQMAELLIFAKRHVAFVQANMIASERDDPKAIDKWRSDLLAQGVWANKPVPLFPYPGSPIYSSRWGEPDDQAWERAHQYYLDTYSDFSDIQEQDPAPLRSLEDCA